MVAAPISEGKLKGIGTHQLDPSSEPGRRERLRAWASIPSESSTPTTLPEGLRRASSTSWAPVPIATSSTASPSRGAASSSTRRRGRASVRRAQSS
jgi:hypothetical protein